MTAKKAAPSKEYQALAPQQYEVLEVSYINGSLQPRGAIIRLPEGVEASRNLKKVGEDVGAKASAYDETFLSRSIADVTEDLGASTDEELVAHLKFEKSAKGQQRTGMISAIEAEQVKRKG